MIHLVKSARIRFAEVLRESARRIDFAKPLAAEPAQVVSGHARTDPFFDCLVRLGYKPNHIVDVGANRGGWTRTAMKYFPEAAYSLFEPQAELLEGSDLAQDPRVRLHFCGAGPETATMKLTTHHRDDSFSFAPSSRQAANRGQKQIDAPVVALDHFLPGQGLGRADILKIDAEGWDLEVLKGAESTAAQADVVLLEAMVVNKGWKNTIEQVIQEMARREFTVFDFTDLNRSQQQNILYLVEIAFIKRGGCVEEAIGGY